MKRYRTYVLNTICHAILILCALSANCAFAGPLRGKLAAGDPSSFRVLSLSKEGQAQTTTPLSTGSFSVKVKKGSTLHLLDTQGKYYGPIVFPKKESAKAKINASKGNLGKVSVKSSFATTMKSKKREKLFATKRISFSSSTGTRGSGKLGLVLGDETQEQQRAEDMGSATPGDDTDGDGIPNAFDVDDNGDLVFDTVDSQAFTFDGIFPVVFSDLSVEIHETLNLNIGNVSQSEIDALIQAQLSLVFILTSHGETIDSVDLDCTGSSYCDPQSGTAVINGPRSVNALPFDSLLREYDNNGDGFPDLASVPSESKYEIGVYVRATTEQITPGDTYIFRVTSNGQTRELPLTLPFYFVTTTALRSYDDGSGEQLVSYPVAPDGLGSQSQPFQLSSGRVSLSLWRPQRPTIAGAEDGAFRDMGRLFYGVYVVVEEQVYRCAPADFSNLSETLSFRGEATDTQTQEAPLVDSRADAGPNSSAILSYTLDLASCLQRNGVTPSGQKIMIDILASDQNHNNTFQHVHFQLPS